MSTLFCKWPSTDQTKAIAYNDECTAHNPDINPDGNPATWGNVRQDKDGFWIVPLFGPPYTFNDEVVEEPPSCAALRIDAEVIETPDWPTEE